MVTRLDQGRSIARIAGRSDGHPGRRGGGPGRGYSGAPTTSRRKRIKLGRNVVVKMGKAALVM